LVVGWILAKTRQRQLSSEKQGLERGVSRVWVGCYSTYICRGDVKNYFNDSHNFSMVPLVPAVIILEKVLCVHF
jgi:hypothetical protein